MSGERDSFDYEIDGAVIKINYLELADELGFVGKDPTNRGQFNVFYQVAQAGFDLTAPGKEIKNKLEIYREYRDTAGNVITRTKLGTEIEVHRKVRSLKDDLSDVAVVDLLPAGFEVVLEQTPRPSRPVHRERAPVQEEVEEGEGEGAGESEYGEAGEEYEEDSDAEQKWAAPIGQEKSTWQTEYVDIREDRVVLFGAVGTTVREFVYRIKAINKGTFAVPPG